MRGHLLRGSGIAAVCASALAACGSNPATTQPIKGASHRPRDSRTVRIYSSLPEQGPLRAESEAIMQGIKLAAHQQRDLVKHQQQNNLVREYTIRYTPLNDATAASHGWNASQVEKNAQTAARNAQTVFYIGDLDSDATKLSLPILNQAGIVQVTPGSAYVGLTDSVKGLTKSSEPLKYYPIRNSRTLLRMVPSDLVEAEAGLRALQTYSGGCKDVAVAALGYKGDAVPLSEGFKLQARGYGFTVVPSQSVGRTTASFEKYAQFIKEKGAGCFVMTGRATPAAVELTRAVHAELPRAMIIATHGFCNSSWTAPDGQDAPSAIDTYLYCTRPVLPVYKYSGYKAFVAAYRQVFKGKATPTAYTLYGYEAAQMAVEAIAELGSGEDNRAVVRNALIHGGARDSAVLGPYGFNSNGDTTSRTFGLYRGTGTGGTVKYYRKITAPVKP